MDCHDWTDEKWEKVSAYHEKLTVSWEKKEERKAMSSSSSLSGFASPSVMSIQSVLDLTRGSAPESVV